MWCTVHSNFGNKIVELRKKRKNEKKRLEVPLVLKTVYIRRTHHIFVYTQTAMSLCILHDMDKEIKEVYIIIIILYMYVLYSCTMTTTTYHTQQYIVYML